MSYFDACVKCRKKFDERSYCFTQCSSCCPRTQCKFCNVEILAEDGTVCFKCDAMTIQAEEALCIV